MTVISTSIFDTIETQDHLVFDLKTERLDAESCKILAEVINPTAERHVVIDFSQVRFVESAALGFIAFSAHRLHFHGGTLRVCCLGPNPYSAFAITNVSRILDGVYDTREEALMRDEP